MSLGAKTVVASSSSSPPGPGSFGGAGHIAILQARRYHVPEHWDAICAMALPRHGRLQSIFVAKASLQT
ncbi:hypothetical protein NHJ6243_006057 [Beauveria neobassiana]